MFQVQHASVPATCMLDLLHDTCLGTLVYDAQHTTGPEGVMCNDLRSRQCINWLSA